MFTEKFLIDSLWSILPVLIPVVIWSLAWKGVALWKAGRRNDVGWFVALLIVNTLGILEILYIFIFSKRKPENT